MIPAPNRALAALSEPLASSAILGDARTSITGIACRTDLGDVLPGVLFAPLDQAPKHAQMIAARAVQRGAAALLLEKAIDLPLPQLIVPNVRAALAQVAAAFYKHPARELFCIGVTGTAGKTTTTLLIDAILRAAGLRPGLIGTLEWRVGDTWTRHKTERTTPEAPDVQRILRHMVDSGDRWAILEASSQGLALDRLQTVPFAIGAMTSITQDHLEFHGSVAAYRRAKAILFESLADTGGVAVLNADDPAAREMATFTGGRHALSYSAAGGLADFRATHVAFGPTGTRFTLSAPDGTAALTLPLLGECNLANALCAAAVAHAAGIPLSQIVEVLEGASPTPGLLAPIAEGQPFHVFIDEAKSAAALVRTLELARQLLPHGRVIALVSGSDLARSGSLHQKGEITALAADNAVFSALCSRATDPATLMAQLATGARAAGWIDGVHFSCVLDRRDAIAHALRMAQPGDCVLLTGQGIADTLLVGDKSVAWDEAANARQVLADLGYAAVPDQETPHD